MQRYGFVQVNGEPASRRDAAFVRITDVMRGAVRSNVSTELQSLTGLLPAG
ncbi:MAG: hypothetical protein LBG45_12885 [Dysgonamonadaceae bacterium]|jgi:hypothetical protein|nr:hypothetical protein [Dysgonamonadaceae bacterium]